MPKQKVLTFNFGKIMDLIDQLDSNKEEAVSEAIIEASKVVQPQLDKFFEKGSHRKSGRTDASFEEHPKIKVYKGIYEMELGFRRNDGGFVAYYFEHGTKVVGSGTPRIAPTKFISYAFKQPLARKTMMDILKKYIEKGGNI